jgi:hypothetical protein
MPGSSVRASVTSTVHGGVSRKAKTAATCRERGQTLVASEEVRAPLKSYDGAISMLCGGVAMLGVAQALRLLLFVILMHAQ